jgi:DnaJ-domain-containing protein 1
MDLNSHPQTTDIRRLLNPEERELNKKLTELDTLEAQLAERELELATLSAEIRVFEVSYLRIVCVRYAKLDEIMARIAEAQARLNPTNSEASERAANARTRAQESAHTTSDIHAASQKTRMSHSEGLNRLYRMVARKIHPDLCTDEEERLRRGKLMAEANRAFEEGDEETLKRILNEWESRPEAVKGEDVAARLVRVLRQIAQVEERIHSIVTEIGALCASPLFELKEKVEKAQADGEDLLSEMATRLDDEIAEAEDTLKQISVKQTRA